MTHRSRIGLGALIALTAATFAGSPAFAFSGSLTSLLGGGITGTGNWIQGGTTTLSWNVTQNADQSWRYAYEFSHPAGETSHFILEVSPTFTEEHIFNASGDFEEIEIGTFTGGPGNPNMPGSIYGIKFDDADGLLTSIVFDSWRMPVWGDFYAKNGNAGGYGVNAAWNMGLTANDVDPLGPASDGSLDYHLLVPDTFGGPEPPTPPVPEPSSLLLLGLGVAGVAVGVRQRRRGTK